MARMRRQGFLQQTQLSSSDSLIQLGNDSDVLSTSEVEILVEPYREVKRQVKKKGNTATEFCRLPGVHKHTLAAIMIPIVNKHYGKCSVRIMTQLKL